MPLREEKKAATRAALADAAMGLFLERGFDKVTVAEVAAAARVSVNTAFNYFPAKEDLFFDRRHEVESRLAEAVLYAEDPAAACLALFLDELERDDPTLGLSPGANAFFRIIDDSPALQARLRRLAEAAESALAECLRPSLGADAAWAAAILAGIDRALHAEIRRAMLVGEDPAATRDAVRVMATRAFAAAGRALSAAGQNGHHG